jgi:electron transport complex protein RnfB
MNAAQRLAMLAHSVDQLLPQTQCRQCGYAGCRPYAEAIAAGRAGINQCPPGGEETIQALSTLLGVPVVALDSARGVHKPPAVAVIDEAICIGCALCIQACPVDAIVGAAKVMHTVIAAHCTGCELCIPPCPVDCIRMSETEQLPTRQEEQAAAEQSRRRYLARNERLARDRAEQNARRTAVGNTAEEKKRLTVKRAVERARARLRQQQTGSGNL